MRGESRLLWLMGAFGFLSGLPLSLTAFTLQLWFTTFGISVHAIGLTAWLGLPYTVKFLWSAFFDRAPPASLAYLGRRRFWLLVVQPPLAGACAAMALSDPGHRPALTAAAGLALAFFSASQDILIDAWRIETFPERLQGAALAAYVWGYRGAMLASTSGVLFLSALVGWRAALLGAAALLAGGIVVTLLAPAAVAVAAAPRAPGWRAGVEAAFLAPLRDFLARRGALTVLAFVILFRVGKVFADGTAASFYRYGVGFTPAAIASANLYGWAGTLAGAAAGAWLVLRLGTARALLAAGLGQAASLGLYLALLAGGPHTALLTAKIVLENFAGATADMAFLTYVSALCSAAYTATQYALLSSLAAVAFHTLGGLSGYLAEAMGYRAFYGAAVLASLPALLLLLQIGRMAHPVPPPRQPG
jgi:PAT family beta-lactamase induction signal transducer AmpG